MPRKEQFYRCNECTLSGPCYACSPNWEKPRGCLQLEERFPDWQPEFVKPFQEVLDDLISAVHKEAEVRKEIEHDQEKGLCPFGLIGMQVELLEKIRELRDVLLRRHEEKRG